MERLVCELLWSTIARFRPTSSHMVSTILGITSKQVQVHVLQTYTDSNGALPRNHGLFYILQEPHLRDFCDLW